MPAEIEVRDGKASFFSANRIPAWHKLGEVTEDCLTAEQAIKTARMDWAVRKHPMYIDLNEYNPKAKAPRFVVADACYATYRPIDEPENDRVPVLGQVGNDYEPFQNVEAFSMFDAVVDDGSAKYETAGSLFNGKLIFILARLSRDIKVAGDKVVPYLLLLSSHDGSVALRMMTTPVRVVCANTMRMALGNYETQWSVRHTSNISGRVAEAREKLQLTWDYYDAFEEEVKILMDQTVTNTEVDRILGEVFPKKNTDTLPEKALAVRGLYETSPTIGEYKGTGWGLLNAVNEWETWVVPMRDEGRRPERQAREMIDGGKAAFPLTRKSHTMLKDLRLLKT